MELSSPIAHRAGLLATVREIAPASASAPGAGHRRLLPLAWLAAAGLLALLLARDAGSFLHSFETALRGGWQPLALAALLEAASLAGYVVLLHRVVAGADRRMRPKDSYDITLAGTAATRLLPTAGLGGAAVTVWALRARGLRSHDITERLLAFLLILYGVYMAALLGFGTAVAVGAVPVAGGRALGVLAAVLALVLTAGVVALLAAPSFTAALVRRLAGGSERLAPSVERAMTHVPALRAALSRVGQELRRPHPALLGAVAWWAFDIGVLVTTLHVFGAALPVPVVVLAYFLGTLFNLLPLPGSLSGGLAGTLVVFGAPAAGALAAVLAYRTLAVWLPAASGVSSLFSLRRSVDRWQIEGAAGHTPAHRVAV
jgi:uncharacterized membrane protein YbhN (UPF0104 family)